MFCETSKRLRHSKLSEWMVRKPSGVAQDLCPFLPTVRDLSGGRKGRRRRATQKLTAHMQIRPRPE